MVFVHRAAFGIEAAKEHRVIIIFKGFHNGTGYAVNLVHHRLDLSGLHPLSVDLDHPVGAVQIQQVSARKLFPDISREYHRSSVRKDPEYLLCLRGKTVVRTGKIPDHTDLSLQAVLHFISLRVGHHDINSLKRFSDGRILIQPVNDKLSDSPCSFAQSVGVNDLKVRTEEVDRLFSNGKHPLQACAPADKSFQNPRADKCTGNSVLLKVYRQHVRISAHFIGKHMNMSAHRQGPEILCHCEAEGHGGGCGKNQRMNILYTGLLSYDLCVNIAPCVEDALGGSGRSGGIYDHSPVFLAALENNRCLIGRAGNIRCLLRRFKSIRQFIRAVGFLLPVLP